MGFCVVHCYRCFVGIFAGEDFYGRTLRMLLAGFQRREKKFASFPELVATINKVRTQGKAHNNEHNAREKGR